MSTTSIPVAVFGAEGKMGRLVCAAIEAAPGMSLVARLGRDTERENAGAASVMVDFTHPDSVMDNIRWAIANNTHAVVGTTGLSDEDLAEVESLLAANPTPLGVMVIPNFSLSALLARRFSAIAAKHFAAAEIVEYYSSTKAEAPAGTSREVAKAIAQARSAPGVPTSGDDSPARGAVVDGTPIHAVRMPGFVSRQEVIFAGGSELLTIRFDTLDRSSYMAGVVKAISVAAGITGLRRGLDSVYQ
ncbi:MAG: 4-hydroxy-tetrahydrodipicolinate reductase [Rhodoglobus sp.]